MGMLNRWFLTGNIPLQLCVQYRHDFWLVGVSYLVAVFAAYTAFHLIARVRAAGSGPARLVWLGTAGVSMGLGIWSMHFIAMLAVEIPIPVRFDVPLTALSAAFAVAASVLAFQFVARDRPRAVELGIAGVVLGSGIGLMHYVGMAALIMPAHIYYDPLVFALSVVVAVMLSTAALLMLSAMPQLHSNRFPLARLAGAAVMGLAIVLMHYTGMLATYFYPEPDAGNVGSLFDPSVMTTAIVFVMLSIGGLALVAAVFDRRAQRAEQLLFDAVNSITGGLVIYDEDDRLVLLNEAYRELFPMRAARMVPGMRFADFLQACLAAGEFPDAIGREEEWYAERMRQHQDAKGEHERKLSDGRWILLSERRMRNGGIAGFRIDVTALKQAQTALRESEERLERAQEIAGIGSWEIDLATDQVVWSKQVYRMRGGVPNDERETARDFLRFIGGDNDAKLSEWLARLRQGEAPGPIECRIKRWDGLERFVSVEGRAIRGADGAVGKLAGTIQDITERRLTEQQLIQAQKMETVGQLTGGLAHDFNNILGAVIGNLDLAVEGVPAKSPADEACRSALTAALSGAELVKRLLAFSRRQTLQPKPIRLDETIASVLPLIKRTLGEHISIETQFAPYQWSATADRIQLETAILNLTVNARDAMPSGGMLIIETDNVLVDASAREAGSDLKPGEYAVISVSDTGVGMPPDVLSRAFEPFFTTKPPNAGSGLGLSMVFGTMQQLGGSVHIYSEAGVGTTVRLYLPRARIADDIEAGKRKDDRPIAGGKERILLVEDNAPIRALGTNILRGLGYNVTVFDSADAALDFVRANKPIDLLFTDVVMAGRLDGVGLAREVRMHHPGVPILLTSGFSSPVMLREQIEELGAHLIAKPYRKAELALLVRSILDRAPQMAD
jgi:PAS domain S-box-containing protein